jgi:hypothetical protein
VKYPLSAALFWLLLVFSLSAAEISKIPEAQLLVDQALDSLDGERYEEALRLFREARDLDRENGTIADYIASLSRIVSLEDYRTDPEQIDAFIQERENGKASGDSTARAEGGEMDFITREQNKEKARQERSRGEILLGFPLLNSSRGTGELDNDLRLTGGLFQGTGYYLSYFPELLNRTIGVEGGWESYSLYLGEELNLYDETFIGFFLRNFFNEQPGFYSLVGTHFAAGLRFGENRAAETREFESFWRVEVFFRDPLLYRVVKRELFKHVALEGLFRFSLYSSTYLLGYGAGLSVDLGARLAVKGNLLYRNYMVKDLSNPSWSAGLGLSYSFR